MLTTKPYLYTRRPSPTTVEYTVSTRPLHPSVTQRLGQLSVLLIRLILGVSTLIVLHTKWRQVHGHEVSNSLQERLLSIWTSVFGQTETRRAYAWWDNPYMSIDAICAFLARVEDGTVFGRCAAAIAFKIPAVVLVPIALLLLYVITLRLHIAESLLVVRGLGIQTQSTGRTWLWSGATRFIPTEKIQDVLVNEAFRGFEVRYYLIVVVEGEEDVVVVFPGLLPRRHIVETVWRGARKCLYGPEGRLKRNDSGR